MTNGLIASTKKKRHIVEFLLGIFVEDPFVIFSLSRTVHRGVLNNFWNGPIETAYSTEKYYDRRKNYLVVELSTSGSLLNALKEKPIVLCNLPTRKHYFLEKNTHLEENFPGAGLGLLARIFIL